MDRNASVFRTDHVEGGHLMSEITGRDIAMNGVDEACELLKEIMEIKGLYFLKFTFTYSGTDVCPTIDYQISKFTGLERDKEIK